MKVNTRSSSYKNGMTRSRTLLRVINRVSTKRVGTGGATSFHRREHTHCFKDCHQLTQFLDPKWPPGEYNVKSIFKDRTNPTRPDLQNASSLSVSCNQTLVSYTCPDTKADSSRPFVRPASKCQMLGNPQTERQRSGLAILDP